MTNPWKTVGRLLDSKLADDLVLVFDGIDTYKRAEIRKLQQQLALIGRVDTDGEQA